DRRHERRGERLPRRGRGPGDLRQRAGGRERRRLRPARQGDGGRRRLPGDRPLAVRERLRALRLAHGRERRARRRAAPAAAERHVIHAEVARAEATLGAARAFLAETVGAAWERAQAAGAIEVRERARLRLAATHATLASARAVDLMYGAGGGTAVYAASPLQRCFRDIHVATQHMMVAPATPEPAGLSLL